MKKVLVIGSTVVDIIINVDRLPTSKGDIHIKSQEMSMGGCAYNVADILRHFGVPHTLFSPIGTG
ncbi:MAG: PfkB family carbohydrate kinase, partial [Oscillospiraceae bacterium]